MSGARPAGDVAELPELLAQLRTLVREAHEVVQDLRAATREAKACERDMADACARAAYEASSDEMARWAAHVQREMNGRAKDLNRAVLAARDHIARSLLPKIAEVHLTDGEPARLSVEFTGSLFDADVPVPDVPEVPPGLRRAAP